MYVCTALLSCHSGWQVLEYGHLTQAELVCASRIAYARLLRSLSIVVSYTLEFFRRSFYCSSWQRKKGGVEQTDLNRDIDERENGKGGGGGGKRKGRGGESAHRADTKERERVSK